jgi:hypothetical protein
MFGTGGGLTNPGSSASSTSFVPTGSISSTTVQAAIEEVNTECVHIAGTETITGQKTFSDRLNASQGGYAFYASGGGGFGSSGSANLVTSSLGGGAAAKCAKIGTQVEIGSVHATARIASFCAGIYATETELAWMSGAGELEFALAGVGIIMRSPDGTRWRVTVTNAGALLVAPA